MRISFKTEQKLEDLRGYSPHYAPGNMDNPYKASECNDDEYNFLSGMNYVLSFVTDVYLSNAEHTDGEGTLDKIRAEIRKEVIEDFAQWGYAELGEVMTSFIDGHEDEEEDAED